MAIIAIISLFFLPHDNVIEQLMEKEIYDLTGVDVDFTPESKPLKKHANPKGSNGPM